MPDHDEHGQGISSGTPTGRPPDDQPTPQAPTGERSADGDEVDPGSGDGASPAADGGEAPPSSVGATDGQQASESGKSSSTTADEAEGDADSGEAAANESGQAPGAEVQERARPSVRRVAIRRGVVLGLLLIAILISTSFVREGSGGPLHSVKSAITSVSGRVQEIAVAAVRPLRDAWNWVADIRTVRDERDALEEEVARLRQDITGLRVDSQRLEELEKALAVADERPSDYRAIGANIIARPVVDVAREARIDRGRDDGVTVNSLVFIPVGDAVPTESFGVLVGRVTSVDATTADIVFLTSSGTSIAARALLSNTPLGLLKVNTLGDLVAEGVPGSATLSPEETVVTMGVGTDRLPSPYPPGIPIGYISSFGGAETGGDYTVQVTPFADPNQLRTVVVYIPQTGLARRRAGLR